MREALGEKKKPPALMDFLVRQRAFVRMQEEFVIDKVPNNIYNNISFQD